MIPFNKPYVSGKEMANIRQAVEYGWLAGNGRFTKACEDFLEQRYGVVRAMLTHSATAALEMMAILLELKAGDEVIVPSFTFITTANAFALHGANIVFADSLPGHPNMDAGRVEELITPRTRAVVAMHYAGDICDMPALERLCRERGVVLLEDAAMAIESSLEGQKAGSFGDMAVFSFHETKNIISGEGGALLINRAKWVDRAEIIREKGSNRAAFFRGECDKYSWVDLGSSFLPSELQAAYLFAQLEALDEIQAMRKTIWTRYHEGFSAFAEKGYPERPAILPGREINYHSYYLICRSLEERSRLITFLSERGIQAVFHYQSLDQSPFAESFRHGARPLPHAARYSDRLLRLPFYNELSRDEQDHVIASVCAFYAGV